MSPVVRGTRNTQSIIQRCPSFPPCNLSTGAGGCRVCVPFSRRRTEQMNDVEMQDDGGGVKRSSVQ